MWIVHVLCSFGIVEAVFFFFSKLFFNTCFCIEGDIIPHCSSPWTPIWHLLVNFSWTLLSLSCLPLLLDRCPQRSLCSARSTFVFWCRRRCSLGRGGAAQVQNWAGGWWMWAPILARVLSWWVSHWDSFQTGDNSEIQASERHRSDPRFKHVKKIQPWDTLTKFYLKWLHKMHWAHFIQQSTGKHLSCLRRKS